MFLCRQRCELRKCIHKNKKEQEKQTRKDQYNKEQSEEETSSAENQQINNLNLYSEEYETQSDADKNEEADSDNDSIINDDTEINEAETNEADTNEASISYQCSKCGKKFSKKHYAKVHCKVKVPIKCEICGAMKSSKNIKRHKKSCAEILRKAMKQAPIFSCSICGQGFPNTFNLRRHKYSKHGENFVGQIRCQVLDCEFSTNNKHQMARHNTMSHSNKGIKCLVCGYRLSSESGLRKHMLAIHGFECEKCGKMFPVEDMLKKHIALLHKDQILNSERSEQVVVSRNIGEHATYTRNGSN